MAKQPWQYREEQIARMAEQNRRYAEEQEKNKQYDPTRQYLREGISPTGQKISSIVDFDRDSALSDKFKMGFDPSRVDYDFANKYAEYLAKNGELPADLNEKAIKDAYSRSNAAISKIYKDMLGQRTPDDPSGEKAVASALRAQEALSARDIRTPEEYEAYEWKEEEEADRKLVEQMLDMYDASNDKGEDAFWDVRNDLLQRDLMTKRLLYPDLQAREPSREGEKQPWDHIESFVGMQDANKRLQAIIGDEPLLESKDGVYRFKDPNKMKALRRELETIRNENEYTRSKEFWSGLPDLFGNDAEETAGRNYYNDQQKIEADYQDEAFLPKLGRGLASFVTGYADLIPAVKDAIGGFFGAGDPNEERAATNARMSEIERALEVFELAKDGVVKGEIQQGEMGLGGLAFFNSPEIAKSGFRFAEGALGLGEFVGIDNPYDGSANTTDMKLLRSKLERERGIEMFEKLASDISAPFIREGDEETISDQVAQFAGLAPGLLMPAPKGSKIVKAFPRAFANANRLRMGDDAYVAAKMAEQGKKLQGLTWQQKALSSVGRRVDAWKQADTWSAKALNLPDKLAETPYIGAMMNVVKRSAAATGRALTSEEARDEALDMGLKFAVANYLTENGNANSAEIAEAARSGALFGYAGNVLGKALAGAGSKALQYFGNKAPNAAVEKLASLSKYSDEWSAEAESMFGINAFKESAKQAVKTAADNTSKALLSTAGRPLAEVAETRVVDAMEQKRLSALWSNKEGQFDLMLRNEDYADMISGAMMMMAPMGKANNPYALYRQGKIAVTDWRSLNREIKKVEKEVGEFTQDVEREMSLLKSEDLGQTLRPDDVVGKARRYQDVVTSTFGKDALTLSREDLQAKFRKLDGIDSEEKFNKGFFSQDIYGALSKPRTFGRAAIEKSIRQIAKEEGIDVEGRYDDEIMADVVTKLGLHGTENRLEGLGSKGMDYFLEVADKYREAAEKYSKKYAGSTPENIKKASLREKLLPLATRKAEAKKKAAEKAKIEQTVQNSTDIGITPLSLLSTTLPPTPYALKEDVDDDIYASPETPVSSPGGFGAPPVDDVRGAIEQAQQRQAQQVAVNPVEQAVKAIKQKASKLPKPADVIEKEKTRGTPEDTNVDPVVDPVTIEEVNSDIASLEQIDPFEAMAVEADIIDPQVAAEVDLIAANAFKALQAASMRTEAKDKATSDLAKVAEAEQQAKQQQDVIALASQGVPVEEAQKILQQGDTVKEGEEGTEVNQDLIDEELGGATAKGDPTVQAVGESIREQQSEQDLDDWELMFSDSPIDSPDMPTGMNFRATSSPAFDAKTLEMINLQPDIRTKLAFNVALGRAVYNRLARKFGYEPKFSMFYDPKVKFSGVNTDQGIRVMAGLKSGTIAETVAHEFYHSLLDQYADGNPAMRNIFVNSIWDSDLKDRLTELYEYGMPPSAVDMIRMAEQGDVGSREEVLVQAMAHYGASDAMGVGIDFFRRVYSEVNAAAQQKIAPLGIAEETMRALKDAYAVANAKQAIRAQQEAPKTPITEGGYRFSLSPDEDDAVNAEAIPIEQQSLEKLLHKTESVKRRKEDPVDELVEVLNAIPGHFKEKKQDMLRSLVDGRLKDPRALRAYIDEKVNIAFPDDGTQKTKNNKATLANRLVAQLGAFGEMYERPTYIDIAFDTNGRVTIKDAPSTQYRTPAAMGGKRLSEFKKKRAGFAQYASRVKDMFYTGGPESHVGTIIQGFAASTILDVGSFLPPPKTGEEVGPYDEYGSSIDDRTPLSSIPSYIAQDFNATFEDLSKRGFFFTHSADSSPQIHDMRAVFDEMTRVDGSGAPSMTLEKGIYQWTPEGIARLDKARRRVVGRLFDRYVDTGLWVVQSDKQGVTKVGRDSSSPQASPLWDFVTWSKEGRFSILESASDAIKTDPHVQKEVDKLNKEFVPAMMQKTPTLFKEIGIDPIKRQSDAFMVFSDIGLQTMLTHLDPSMKWAAPINDPDLETRPKSPIKYISEIYRREATRSLDRFKQLQPDLSSYLFDESGKLRDRVASERGSMPTGMEIDDTGNLAVKTFYIDSRQEGLINKLFGEAADGAVLSINPVAHRTVAAIHGQNPKGPHKTAGHWPVGSSTMLWKQATHDYTDYGFGNTELDKMIAALREEGYGYIAIDSAIKGGTDGPLRWQQNNNARGEENKQPFNTTNDVIKAVRLGQNTFTVPITGDNGLKFVKPSSLLNEEASGLSVIHTPAVSPISPLLSYMKGGASEGFRRVKELARNVARRHAKEVEDFLVLNSMFINDMADVGASFDDIHTAAKRYLPKFLRTLERGDEKDKWMIPYIQTAMEAVNVADNPSATVSVMRILQTQTSMFAPNSPASRGIGRSVQKGLRTRSRGTQLYITPSVSTPTDILTTKKMLFSKDTAGNPTVNWDYVSSDMVADILSAKGIDISQYATGEMGRLTDKDIEKVKELIQPKEVFDWYTDFLKKNTTPTGLPSRQAIFVSPDAAQAMGWRIGQKVFGHITPSDDHHSLIPHRIAGFLQSSQKQSVAYSPHTSMKVQGKDHDIDTYSLTTLDAAAENNPDWRSSDGVHIFYDLWQSLDKADYYDGKNKLDNKEIINSYGDKIFQRNDPKKSLYDPDPTGNPLAKGVSARYAYSFANKGIGLYSTLGTKAGLLLQKAYSLLSSGQLKDQKGFLARFGASSFEEFFRRFASYKEAAVDGFNMPKYEMTDPGAATRWAQTFTPMWSDQNIPLSVMKDVGKEGIDRVEAAKSFSMYEGTTMGEALRPFMRAMHGYFIDDRKKSSVTEQVVHDNYAAKAVPKVPLHPVIEEGWNKAIESFNAYTLAMTDRDNKDNLKEPQWLNREGRMRYVDEAWKQAYDTIKALINYKGEPEVAPLIDQYGPSGRVYTEQNPLPFYMTPLATGTRHKGAETFFDDIDAASRQEGEAFFSTMLRTQENVQEYRSSIFLEPVYFDKSNMMVNAWGEKPSRAKFGMYRDDLGRTFVVVDKERVDFSFGGQPMQNNPNKEVVPLEVFMEKIGPEGGFAKYASDLVNPNSWVGNASVAAKNGLEPIRGVHKKWAVTLSATPDLYESASKIHATTEAGEFIKFGLGSNPHAIATTIAKGLLYGKGSRDAAFNSPVTLESKARLIASGMLSKMPESRKPFFLGSLLIGQLSFQGINSKMPKALVKKGPNAEGIFTEEGLRNSVFKELMADPTVGPPRIFLSPEVDIDPIKALAAEQSERLGFIFNPMLAQAALSPSEVGSTKPEVYGQIDLGVTMKIDGIEKSSIGVPRFSTTPTGVTTGSAIKRTYWDQDPAVRRFALSAMRMKAVDTHFKRQQMEALYKGGNKEYPLKQRFAEFLGYGTPREFRRMAAPFAGDKDPYVAIYDGTFDVKGFRQFLSKELLKDDDTLFSSIMEASDRYFDEVAQEMSNDVTGALGYNQLAPTVRGLQAYESYVMAKDLGKRMKAMEKRAWMQEPQADTFWGRVRYGWITSVADGLTPIRSTPKAAAHLMGTQRKAMANSDMVASFIGADGVATVLTAADVAPRNPFGIQYGGGVNMSIAAAAIERMDFYDRMTRDFKERLINVAQDASSYVKSKEVSDLVQLLANHDDVLPIAYEYGRTTWITPAITYKGITANTRDKNANWALLVETVANDIENNPKYSTITKGLSKEEIQDAAGAYLANALFYETLKSNVDGVLKPNYDAVAAQSGYYAPNQLFYIDADVSKRLYSKLPGYSPEKLSHQQPGIMHASQDAKLLDTVNLLSKIDAQLSSALGRKVNKEPMEPKAAMKKLREDGFFKGKPPELEQEVRSLLYLHNKYLRMAEGLAFSTMTEGDGTSTNEGMLTMSYDGASQFNVDEKVTTEYDANSGTVASQRSLVDASERKITGRISADTYKRFIDEITQGSLQEFTDMAEFIWRKDQMEPMQKGVVENLFIEQEVASLASRLRGEQAMSTFYVDDFKELEMGDEVTVMVDATDDILSFLGNDSKEGMVTLMKIDGNTYVDMKSGLGVELKKGKEGYELIYSKYEDDGKTKKNIDNFRVVGDRIMRRDSNVAGNRRDRDLKKAAIQEYIRSNMPTFNPDDGYGKTAYMARQTYAQRPEARSIPGMLDLANKMMIYNGYLGYEKVITTGMLATAGALTFDPMLITGAAVSAASFVTGQAGKMAQNFGSIARVWLPMVGFKNVFSAFVADSKTQIDSNIDQTVTRFVEAEIGSEDMVSMIEKNKLRKRTEIMDQMFREASQLGETVPFNRKGYEDRHWAAELNPQTLDNIEKEIAALDPAGQLGAFYMSPTGRLLDEEGRTQAEVKAIADGIRREIILDRLNMKKMMSWSEEKAQGFAKTVGLGVMKELGLVNTRNRGMMNAALRANIEYSAGLYGNADRMRYEFGGLGKLMTVFNKFARPMTEMTMARMWDNMGGDLFLRQMHAAAVKGGMPGLAMKHTKYGDLIKAPVADATGASVLSLYPWMADTNARFSWAVATGAISWMARQGWRMMVIGALGRASGLLDEDDENNASMTTTLQQLDKMLDLSGLGNVGLSSVAENTFRTMYYMFNELGNYFTGKYVEERMMNQKAGKRKAIDARTVKEMYLRETIQVPSDLAFSLGVGSGTSSVMSGAMELGMWAYYNGTKEDSRVLRKAMASYNAETKSYMTDKALSSAPLVGPAYTTVGRPAMKTYKAMTSPKREVPENRKVFLNKK